MAGSATLTTVESTVTTAVPRIAATRTRLLVRGEATSGGWRAALHQAEEAPFTESAERGPGRRTSRSA